MSAHLSGHTTTPLFPDRPVDPDSLIGITPELLMFFGRMEAKLDHTLEWIQRHETDSTESHRKIAALERAHARMIGIAITLSAGVSFGTMLAGYIALSGQLP